MKKILTLLCCTALLFASAFAQKPPIKFGDIPMEDMKMTVYPLDSGAEAVVLADFGISSLDYSQASGFQLHFERTRRVKILKKEGLAFAEFMIPLWSDNGKNAEKISSLKVVTYNLENGKIVETKVKSDNFFREKYDADLTFMKVAWTNVKEGSIIELHYTVLSEFIMNFQDWEFQSTIPVRWSEYRAKIPEYFNYQKYAQGYVAMAVAETTSRNISITIGQSATEGSETVDCREDNFRWAARNVPAFKREPYMTTVSDYLSKINFELAFTKFPGAIMKNYMGSWEDINRLYYNAVKADIKSNAISRDEMEKLIGAAQNDEQKVAALYNYVRSNVLWDETSRRYPNTNPRKTLDAKKGSSADINILLTSLLDQAGVRVTPLLLSTRDHGFIRDAIPAMQQFNYVVCLAQVGTTPVLLDATDRMLPIGVLPERCLNGKGLAIIEEGPQWVSLQPFIKSRTICSADVVLTDNGEAKGTLKYDKSGYHSVRARRQYHLKGEGEYVKSLSGSDAWTLSDSKFENTQDINLPFKELHQLIANEVATVSDAAIYFNPILVGREEKNPFKSETREYPVDFGNQFEDIYMARITIPDGYVIEELPPSKVINLPEGAARYVYNIGQQGNLITLTSGLYINRSIFTQDVYPNLREFFNQMIAKQAEQVVLKRK